MSYYEKLCEQKSQKNPLCDECHINNKNPNFNLQSRSYYRCCPSGEYFFCCQECKDKYENTKLCKRCHYYDDLRPVDDHMLCDTKAYNLSCYDKYMKEKEEKNCDFCYDECSDGNTFETIHVCNKCFAKYEDIVLHRYEDNNANFCVFCNDRSETSIERDAGEILFCNRCYETYKKMTG